MKQVAVSLLLFLFCVYLLYGAEDISQRESVRKGIELIYDLDYAEATLLIEKELKQAKKKRR